MKSIKIASGSGFWGDWLLAPIAQIKQGEIDYLVMDYLAEVTMSIMAKQQQRNPEHGFARDFVELMKEIGSDCERRNVRVIANAGGMNPRACAKAIIGALSERHVSLRVAVVEGDNILPQLDSLLDSGESFSHFETQESFSPIRPRLISANTYIGCGSVVEALRAGAQVVVTGRVADPSLALAAMVYEFGWAMDDWHRLAAGTVAGHILECGAQASGGNDAFDWKSIPDLAHIGYPIVEMREDGYFEVYKHPHTGGRISRATVVQQLLYEIGDPTRYIIPDVVADFTSLTLSTVNADRVAIHSVRGAARPERLKVSMSYDNGFMAVGSMLYCWPEAEKKARAAAEIVKQRLAQAGCHPQRLHTELVGVDACFGPRAPQASEDLAEVQLRIAAHDRSKSVVERFSREIAPLVLNGPPFATAYASGKGRVSEVYAYWPSSIAREKVQTSWEILNG